MVSNILSGDIAQEVEALTRRTKFIRRVGTSVAVIGGITAAAGLVGKICSRVVSPSITDFKFDVPASVLSKEPSFGNAFDGISYAYDSFASILEGPIFYVPATVTMGYFAYKCLTGNLDSAHLPMLAVTGLMLMSPKVVTNLFADTSDDIGRDSHKKVERYIKDDEYSRLITYLKESGSGVQPGSLPFDYVVAQAGVKEGKPDIPAIKAVIAGYNTANPFTTVPGSVRYALEMTAFDGVVTEGAKQYQAKQLSESTYLSEKGRQGGLTGGVLLLLGASILLWVRQITRRVNFLKTSLIKW
ncbi:hypothetical protein ABKU49_06015 [Enterobacter hormaechei]